MSATRTGSSTLGLGVTVPRRPGSSLMSLVVPACAERPCPWTGLTPMTAFAPDASLRRFVTDGLRDTVDSYLSGNLPLHRFSWELESRLAMLAELTGLPRYRTLA